MMDKKSANNPWTLEDEKEHPSSALEWWCVEAFFKSIENKEKWTFKADFTEWNVKPKSVGSIYKFMLLNQNNEKIYVHDIRDETKRLTSSNNILDVKFKESYITGAFPDYEMYFKNQKHDVELSLKYNAKSYPHWIAQNVTNGYLPAGLGFYKYGFIPKGDISGLLRIKNKKFTITGEGYYEHVWGEFTYQKLIGNIKSFKKSISTYGKLFKHWIQDNDKKIPKTIMFGTENSPLGYDWAWALLDNGWSIFFGNIMFWLMEGPAAGLLILTKDGKTYEEWFNINFKYNQTQKAKGYDFHYPTELEINATKGNEKLHMTFKMTSKAREYVSKFADGKYWIGISICEAPGIIEGYYENNAKRTKLSGICKIEPQRQISISGHNTLKIDILKPPNGFGLSLDFHSNLLKKKMSGKMHLLPKLKFCLNLKNLKSTKKN
jgi:hypothetical protein